MASNVIQLTPSFANDNDDQPPEPFGSRRLLQEFMDELTDGEGPIDGSIWADRSWLPALHGSAEVIEFFNKITAEEENEAKCLCMLAGLNVETMRVFASDCGVLECLHIMRCMWGYAERLDHLKDIARSMVARLFALSLEVHGGGTDPLIRRVA